MAGVEGRLHGLIERLVLKKEEYEAAHTTFPWIGASSKSDQMRTCYR